MKITTYKLIVFLLLIPLLGFSNGLRGKYKKSKTVEKTYNVNANALLNINNRYGNVDITTWNKNHIKIQVEITVSGNNEDKVLNKLNGIHIKFEGNSNQVSATTHFNKNKSNSWFSSYWFWGSSKLNYKINYMVKMPISNSLNVSNDYGTILINELDGLATINCDYGKLIIGSLNHTSNKININYTNHSTIEFMESGKINADYSKFTIEKANEIALEADYSSSAFENIKKLNYNCDYGSLMVNKGDYIVGNGDYLSMKFGEIFQKLDITADYGSIKVEHLQEGFKTVKIIADYTSVRIGLDPSASCNIVAKLSYGGFKYEGDNFTFNKTNIKSSNKYYEGYHRSKNSNATILTTTDYGNVKLYEY